MFIHFTYIKTWLILLRKTGTIESIHSFLKTGLINVYSKECERMEFPKEEVGKRIRHLRKQMALTSDELAKLAGISQSMISQIERGQVSPSLETLWKLSHCLKVPVFSFFEAEASSTVTINRASETKLLKRVRPNVSYQLLSPTSGKQMSFFKMIVAPGEESDSPLMYHSGEECG